MDFILILYVLVILLSIYLGKKTEVSWGKVIMLILFPPLIVAFFIGIKSGGGTFFMIALYGLLLMLPALVFYAVVVLYVVEKYKLGYIAQFLTGGVIGYVAGFILAVIVNQELESERFTFALIPMITGAVSIVLIEYLNTKDEKDAK